MTWVRNRHPEFNPEISLYMIWHLLNYKEIEFTPERRIVLNKQIRKTIEAVE